MPSSAKVFTKGDPEPDVPSGSIAVLNYGDYRSQVVFVSSGANVGNWYPLGGEFGNLRQRTPEQEAERERAGWAIGRRELPYGDILPLHPTWDDLTARGPVTLLVPADEAAYAAGWKDGRQRLLWQIESLCDDEDEPTREGL